MKKYKIFILKFLRKFFYLFLKKNEKLPESIQNADLASKIIYDNLTSNKPLMIARFGSNELLCLISYLGVKANNKNIFTYVIGKSLPWWWNEKNLQNMNLVAGFFPKSVDKFAQFSELLLEDLNEIDVLGSWLVEENLIHDNLINTTKINIELLNPFFSINPWTRALENKKVLVIHPFSKTIESQYKKRELLFKNNLLPHFELITIKAVQTYASIKTDFIDWFDALEFMKNEINKFDFDIALIGCGAYGFSLAAHIKRKGKKAFHLGGSLQLLFGIKGKRWENPNYNKTFNYSQFFNEHWVYPDIEEKPKSSNLVEDSCYW